MKLDDYSKYYIQGSDHYLIPKDEFVELYREMEAWKEQVKNIETIRLDQTKKVFDIIANIIKEGSCSYRHLIYDELGFYGVNYEELLSGMIITNAICDLEDLKVQHEEDLKEIEKLTSIWETKNEEIRQLKEEIKAVNKGLRKVKERASKYKYKSLDLQKDNKELKEENFALREVIKIQSIPSELMKDKSFIDCYDIPIYEELAFKDRITLAQLNELDLLNIIEFLQKDRRQWIDQFTKTHNESVDIKKENQELKKQLKPDYYTNGLEETLKEYQQEMNKVATQQEEFIKYLQDEINKCESNIFADGVKYGFQLSLQKYKEITEKIDNENND